MNENDHRGPSQEIRVIQEGSPAYPPRLLALSDPPAQLQVRGEIPAGPYAAIIGTRGADVQARRFAHRLAGGLVLHGVCVVSGGALGVDTAAHEGALEAGGKTVAVLGSGFDHVYPPSNRELFSQIAGSGALVTEFDAHVPPTRWTFPRRNRIVAALAGAVIVVQAPARSGALLTARNARELEVAVGAVPGSPDDPNSKGCNQLLRGGARLIEGVDDVLEILGETSTKRQLDLPNVVSRGKECPPESTVALGDNEKKILELLGARPLHIDEIAEVTGLAAAEIGAAMVALEIAGLVLDRGGKNYVRLDGTR